MNATSLSAARERRKAERVMETGTDGISSQEEDRARIKDIREQGKITVTASGESCMYSWRVPARANSLQPMLSRTPTLSISS